MNFSWVQPCLAVGGCFPRSAAGRLAAEFRFRHVVDLRQEAMDDPELLQSLGLTLLHVPVADHCALGPDTLDVAAHWVAERIQRRQRVLVHCEHGIGRSVLLALCVLVKLDMEPLAAASLIKRCRACASPSPEQLRTFLSWSAACGRPVCRDRVCRALYASMENQKP